MNRSTLISVVQRGEAKHIMAAARKAGAPGGTVCNARGTATRTILAALGLGDTKQEVLVSVMDNTIVDDVLKSIKVVQAKGIAMIIDTEVETMDSGWTLIEVITEDGYSEEIMATARKAGAGGGTVINAHGTSTEDDVKFFGSPLVPEKEILMIVVPSEKAQPIINAINSMDILKKRGMGILFSIPVKSFMNLSH
ncbi:MAG: hypothetical protein IAA97_04610 [Spirochaetes bacterium]|uniref:P-II family nitrogen regulator n=1 Tax=Candidatus Ornithospirochaeta stercoripullorum TaxID=2840899 RepID=A0A9D9E1M2_9SPIO|nr:hypothetical protein [Candidatus Ornithospirochaeta stercoripullorum]